METRLIIAYALIALMIAVALWGVIAMKRRQRIRRPWRHRKRI